MKDQTLMVVAEDDPDDQYFLQEALKVVCPNDVEVLFVFDGKQLMNVLLERSVGQSQRKLIVLDLNMPVKDGRSTLSELKSHPAFLNIPVIILTTSDNREDMEYASLKGAVAYYRKPSSIGELVDIMRTICRDYLD